MRSVFGSLLLLCTLWCASVEGAYFRMQDYQPVCFAEEVGYGSQVVMVEYHRRRSTFGDELTVNAYVTSPLSRTKVYTGKVREGSGSFSFQPTANEMGQYEICFTAPDLDAASGRHIDLAISVDHHDRKQLLQKPETAVTRQKVGDKEVYSFIDYDGQPKETLRTHEYLERVRTLLANIAKETQEVRNEVAYFQGRTERMRSTSESTFERIWAFSVLTISAIVACSYLQYAFLKSFLKAKKRV
jgi:hypothetical protein